MTIVARTVSPRNSPRGAPAATGHPAAPQNVVIADTTDESESGLEKAGSNRDWLRLKSDWPPRRANHARTKAPSAHNGFPDSIGSRGSSGRAQLFEEPIAGPLADEPQ